MFCKCCLATLIGAMAVMAVPATGWAAIEIGLGVMPPVLDDGALGALTLAPRIVFGTAGLGVSLDAWASPTANIIVLMPFLQLSVGLQGFRVYGGAAPVVLASTAGLTPISPLLGFAAKAGGAMQLMPAFNVYGEWVLGISPLLTNPVSSMSSVIGISVGF